MYEGISKKSLMESINLISELDFGEEDLDKIFAKFKGILERSDIEEKINQIQGLDENLDIKYIMKLIIQNLSLDDLNSILQDLMKEEDLIDQIQDLFLEKLL